jgi:hypothetical protein
LGQTTSSPANFPGAANDRNTWRALPSARSHRRNLGYPQLTLPARHKNFKDEAERKKAEKAVAMTRGAA